MAKGAINVKIEGEYSDKDIKRAIKDLESLKTQGAPAAKSVGGLTTAFKGMALAAGAFVGISAVKDFMGDAISAGSDLEESLSKVNVVFGKSADEVIAWSESSAKAFGQSRQQALESVGTFGNLLQAFGSTQAEAQQMSQRMVELAADLASFNNTSVDDALNALRSGLSGETEPLKKFGVALNDARLKTVALEKGLYSGKGTLDVYAKSVAAYELILKDTALAQGDFARTSDGFANQMRILEATVDDAKATIGTELLIGIQSVTEAFGGTDGMTSIVEGAGEGIADFTAGIMLMVEQLGLAVTAVNDFVSIADNGLVDFALQVDRIINPVQRLIGDTLEMGAAERDHREAMEKSTAAAEALYAGYIAYADGAEQASDATYIAEQAAQSAEDALKALKDEVNALKGAISDRQAMDDFRKSLRDLGETLKDNERTFKGMGDAALENRETLRTAFSDAADIVQGWVESGKISADEFDAAYAKLGSKVVDNFVKQGFTRSDIRKFLKSEGMWMAEFATVGDYASAAGVNIGKDLLRGMAGGLSDPNNLATLRYAAMQAAREAENAVREESKTQSPSKVFAEIGKDLTAGLVQGIRAGGEDVRKSMQSVYLDAFRETKQKLKDELQEAKDAFNDFRSTVSQAIMGGIDFGAIAPEFDENGQRVGMTFIEALNAQAQQAQQFAEKVKLLVASGLSQEALQRVLQAGVEAGTAIADELIAGGTTTIDTTNKLVESTQAAADLVGTAAAEKWYGTGVKNAQDTYEGFKANFGKDGPAYKAIQGVMDRLAASMSRTATITVTTVNRQVNQIIDQFGGPRALGGPVAANTAYLVGERGPELFVPNSAGMIVPNADLPTASGVMGGDGAAMGGATYNITVQAGVGDPRQIGQQVVEYIKKFESSNGRVFAAA